ncbi:YgdI/YgdR family lipoprotein [Kushneria sp. AK178]
MKKTLGILLAAMMTFAVAGCDSDDGPAEETGAQVDNAVDDAGDAASDAADSTGEAMEDAGDSISDSAEEHSN